MVSARAAALHALLALEKGRSEYVRDVLGALVLPPREQALAYELAYGVVRRERLLDHVLAGQARRGLPKAAALRCALRLGAYQLLYTGGVPAHAAVDETVALVRNNKGFANALLRRIAERVEARPAAADRPLDELPLGPARALRLPTPLPEDEVERLAVVHSLPTFLVERWRAELGVEAVARIGAAASAVPPVLLRAQPDTDAEALRVALAAEGVATRPAAVDGFLQWTGGESPFASAEFRAGRFVAQDPTAFAAADAVPCGPGDTVVDLCAAPGTKTTWLAGKVRPGGRVFAFDPDETRRYRIAENVARLRLEDTVQIVTSAAELPSARAVLADVPCSNTGVLGRRAEVRRRIAPATFTRLSVLQRALLRQALQLVGPGGHVVYSTCSIDREENDGVVGAVLADAGEFAVERRQLTLPRAGAHDGGFFAVIRRASAGFS